LDSSHLFCRIALLLAFRQDALAAVSLHPEGRQRIAVAVGQLSRDWPLAQRLCCGVDALQRGTVGFQQDAHFLAAAYPTVFASAFRHAGDTYALPPELLYGVVREESFFYPAALSPDGALGLFQFIPSTFDTLDQRWNLLRTSGLSSREEFLLSPARSIDLGGRWFHDYLLPVNNGNIVAALIEHNTNRKLVKAWRASLMAAGRDTDAEYAIEAIPYMSTRVFVKGVLGDLAVMRAAGSLDSQSVH
jgi:soluble lytic murein transglycosylase-like protein